MVQVAMVAHVGKAARLAAAEREEAPVAGMVTPGEAALVEVGVAEGVAVAAAVTAVKEPMAAARGAVAVTWVAVTGVGAVHCKRSYSRVHLRPRSFRWRRARLIAH